MLSLFPQILYLSPLSATLLRVAAALVFLYVAWQQGARYKELAAARFPVVGGGEWVVWTAAVIEVLIALALLIGIYTQGAAILGALAALKFAYWRSRVSALAPISGGTAFLLFVICASLLVTGAGPFAVDLPL